MGRRPRLLDLVATVVVLCVLHPRFATPCPTLFVDSIGYITPEHQVHALAGTSLSLECHLNETYQGKERAENIYWSFHGIKLGKEKGEKREVQKSGERSVKLTLNQVDPSESGNYICYLNPINSTRPMMLCMNRINIGYPPQTLSDFKCLSPNWQYLQCSWSFQKNNIPTNRTLFVYVPKNGRLTRVRCNSPDRSNTCNITTANDSNPLFLNSVDSYRFEMEMHNEFGSLKEQFNVTVAASVLPAAPSKFNVSVVDATKLMVTWKTPQGLEHFKPGLDYKLFYKCAKWRDSYSIVGMTAGENSFTMSKLFPNCEYDVRMRARSTMSSSDGMWGEEANVTVLTPVTVPGKPPNATESNFQEVAYAANRDITLYWQIIPDYMKNGNNFQYRVAIKEQLKDGNTRLLDIRNSTTNYLPLPALDLSKNYLFEVSSENEAGVTESNYIKVPAKEKMMDRPGTFTVIAYEHGVYELSWTPSNTFEKVVSYTLYWCENARPYPFQCVGYLDWTTIPAYKTMSNITKLDVYKNYQFAISANGRESSSGMVWATCIAPYNGTISKMKKVSTFVNGAREIRVHWILDCSERIGIVTGFNVGYCISLDDSIGCRDHPKYEFVNGSHSNNYHLRGLKPFTKYRITVAAVTRAGIGEESEGINNSTLEDVSSRPYNLAVDPQKTTNTSVWLMWNEPDEPNGIITEYEILFNEKSVSIVRGEFTRVNGGGFFLSGLKSYTNYSIRVRAKNSAGVSLESKPLFVKTKVGVPRPTSRPAVQALNSTSMEITLADNEDVIKDQGPKTIFDVKVMAGSGEEGVADQNKVIFEKYGYVGNTLTVPYDCEKHDQTLYFVSRYVNMEGDHRLEGEWGPQREYNPCGIQGGGVSSTLLLVIIGCSAVGVAILVVAMVFAAKRAKLKWQTIKNVRVSLPNGFSDEKQSNGGNRANGIHSPPRVIGVNNFGEARLSASSLDEFLPRGDRTAADGGDAIADTNFDEANHRRDEERAPDHEEGGAIGGTDSVFLDIPKDPKTAPTEGSSGRSSQLSDPHYSRFAHYLHSDPPPQPAAVSPPQPAAPEGLAYAKFGLSPSVGYVLIPPQTAKVQPSPARESLYDNYNSEEDGPSSYMKLGIPSPGFSSGSDPASPLFQTAPYSTLGMVNPVPTPAVQGRPPAPQGREEPPPPYSKVSTVPVPIPVPAGGSGYVPLEHMRNGGESDNNSSFHMNGMTNGEEEQDSFEAPSTSNYQPPASMVVRNGYVTLPSTSQAPTERTYSDA